ncbi:MAG: VOC family protein [Nostoc sp.]|uniref:VOC family protein n=1 Tax=Nostoc sp. TaxID=1180 RepID=UPI002FF79E06
MKNQKIHIGYVQFYVHDATESSKYFVKVFGCETLAKVSSGQTKTEIIYRDSLIFIFTSPLDSDNPVADFLRNHPPGIVDLAFVVQDIQSVMEKAYKLGIHIRSPLQICQYPQGSLQWSQINIGGTLRHTLIERSGVTPLLPPTLEWQDLSWLPCFTENKNKLKEKLVGIDHVAIAIASDNFETIIELYKQIFDLIGTEEYNIETPSSGMQGQVLASSEKELQLVLVHPTSNNSPIQEILQINKGLGVHHLALLTNNILEIVSELRFRGLEFIKIPQNYYQKIHSRYQKLFVESHELIKIIQLEILLEILENNSQQMLLQAFTEPIFSQGNFVFELIERRHQAQGFGERNFRDLYEAIEQK